MVQLSSLEKILGEGLQEFGQTIADLGEVARLEDPLGVVVTSIPRGLFSKPAHSELGRALDLYEGGVDGASRDVGVLIELNDALRGEGVELEPLCSVRPGHPDQVFLEGVVVVHPAGRLREIFEQIAPSPEKDSMDSGKKPALATKENR